MPGNDSLANCYRYATILVLTFNALSALAFIATVHRPVYDEPPNILDVQRYAAEGVTLQSIRSHVNPTGPGSFIWMAAGVRLLDGDGLRAARIAVLASWILLSIGLLLSARRSESPELWYAALLTTLIFPHALTAMGTLMTEGPALLAAMLGTFAWTVGIAQPRMTAKAAGLLLLGGLALGVAVTCRQYYLALFPAAALVALVQMKNHRDEDRRAWILLLLGSLILAAIPPGLLLFAWKGLSSPAMVAGTSYKQWRAGIGLNFMRPAIAGFYVFVYLMLLTFPTPFLLRLARRWLLAACTLAAGAGTAFFRESILQPGPLHSMEKIAGVLWHGEFLAVGLLAALGFYNAAAFIVCLWEKRPSLLANPLVLFSLLAIVFFVLEQIGVGGNIPFYDRYVLQLAPFLGIVVFHVFPGLKAPRLIMFALLTLLSHEMLWRNALSR